MPSSIAISRLVLPSTKLHKIENWRAPEFPSLMEKIESPLHPFFYVQNNVRREIPASNTERIVSK
jgi:hypothetical protein